MSKYFQRSQNISSDVNVNLLFETSAIEPSNRVQICYYSKIELSYFDHKDNHNFRYITKLPKYSSLFSYNLTVESDLQTHIATNRSNITALIASIRLSFLLGWCAQAKFLCSIPICELVGTTIGAAKG